MRTAVDRSVSELAKDLQQVLLKTSVGGTTERLQGLLVTLQVTLQQVLDCVGSDERPATYRGWSMSDDQGR